MKLILSKSVKRGIDTPTKKRVKYGKAKGKVKKLNPLLISHYTFKGFEEVHEVITHEFNNFNGISNFKTDKIVNSEIIAKNDTYFKELKIVKALAIDLGVKEKNVLYEKIYDFKPTKKIPSQWYYLTKDKDGKEIKAYFDLKLRTKVYQPYFTLNKTQSFDYFGKTELSQVTVNHNSVNYILTRAVILALGKNIKNWNRIPKDKDKKQGWHRINVKGKLINYEGEKELIEPFVSEVVKPRLKRDTESIEEYNALLEDKSSTAYITYTKRTQINTFTIMDVIITNVIFSKNGSVNRVFFDKSTIDKYKHLEKLDKNLEALQYLTEECM